MVRPLRSALLVIAVIAAGARAQSSSPPSGSYVIRPWLSGQADRHDAVLHRETVRRPRIGVVLSGGGARGIASVGVLRALERHHIPIDLIVGTSIGSIIGGLYAAGYSPADLNELADTTNWAEVLSYDDDARRRDQFLDQKLATERGLLVLRFDGFEPVIPSAFSSGQRLMNYLNILTLQGLYHPRPSFDDLRVPFRAVSTDLVSGRQYVFRDGDLAQALRASVAVPLLFTAVKKDSMELLDGGLLANMPVGVARDEGMDLVIVVDVTSPLRPASLVNAPWEIGEQIMGIMMQSANREAAKLADVLIRPALGDHISSDFTGLGELVQAGDDATESAVGRIRELFERRSERLYAADPGATHVHPVFEFDSTFSQGPAKGLIDALARRDTVSDAEVRRLVTDLYESGDFAEAFALVTRGEPVDTIRIGGSLFPVLHDIAVDGVAQFPADTVRADLAPLIGRHLNAAALTEAIDGVLHRYREAGFSLAHVRSTTIDSAAGVARIAIDEGRIDGMTIRGTAKTKDYVLWRELPFRSGDVFRVSKIAQGLANLNGTNMFEQVSITVEQEGEGGTNNLIVINAKERQTELIRFGMRVDNERSFQPSIDIRDENFLGVGAELGFRASGGTRNQAFVAEFKAVRIFDSYLTSSLRGYMIKRDVNMFSDEPQHRDDRFERVRTGEIREVRRGGSLSFGTQLERMGNVTVEGRLERHEVYSIFNQPIVNEGYDISSIRFGTRIDTRDRLPFPTEGVGMDFTYESALVRTKGSIGFTKMLLSYEVVSTLGRRHTFRPRFVLGLGDDAVPTSEQFTLGGMETFFGTREDNTRGRQLLAASLEYRYLLPIRIFFDTYATVRYDIGSTWLRPDEIRLVDLQHGIGVGLAMDTPVGPAEFALGRSFYLRKDLLTRPLALGPLLAYFSIGFPLN